MNKLKTILYNLAYPNQELRIYDTDANLIATMNGTFNSKTHKSDVTMPQELNAELICAAVNACIEINPDNPLAVAQNIKDMYEALKLLQSALTEHKLRDIKKRYSLCVADSVASKALAKAEGK